MSAPAGFGKTTLLTEWFARLSPEERTTAWLSLDAGDNDPVLFWTYVVAAVRTVARRSARRVSLLRSAQALESVVTTLLNDLSALTATTSCWCSTTTTSSSRPRSTSRWRSCSSTCRRSSTW